MKKIIIALFLGLALTAQAATNVSLTKSGTSEYLNYLADSLGIGTSSAFARLTVQGAYASLQQLFDVSSSTAANGSATSSVFRINSDGNVGIGTARPTEVNANARLTVAGISSQDIIASTTDNTTLSDAIVQVYAPGSRVFMGAHGTNQVSTRFGITLGGWGEIGAFNSSFNTTNGLIIGTNPAVPLVFGTANTERARILANGFVGIASTTPGTDLAIGNTAASYINFSTTSTSTFSRGVNITSGCFAIGGTCLASTGASTTLLGDNNTFAGTDQFNKLTFTVATGTSATTTNFAVIGNSTSTFNKGIDITGGCFSIGGTCLSTGGSGVTSIGPIGALQTGPNVTLATSSTAYNGLTSSTTITATTNTITFANTLAGILGTGAGGTGLVNPGSVSTDAVLVFNGSSGASARSAGADGTALVSSGGGTTISFSSINLASSNSVGVSVLGITNGGTGTSTNRYGGIFFGDGTRFRQASSTGLADYDPTLQRVTTLNFVTTNATSTSATTTNFAFTNGAGTQECLRRLTNGTVQGTGVDCGSGSGTGSSQWATGTTPYTQNIYPSGGLSVSIGTNTPATAVLTVGTSTGKAIEIRDNGVTNPGWVLGALGGSLILSTTTPSFGTTSNAQNILKFTPVTNGSLMMLNGIGAAQGGIHMYTQNETGCSLLSSIVNGGISATGDINAIQCRNSDNNGLPGGDYYQYYGLDATNSLSVIMSMDLNTLKTAFGTTTPYAQLSVQGSYGTTTPVFDVSSSTTRLGTATSSLFNVNYNGNVGIGTSSPWAKLSITGTYGSALTLFDIASTTNASGGATTSIFSINAAQVSRILVGTTSIFALNAFHIPTTATTTTGWALSSSTASGNQNLFRIDNNGDIITGNPVTGDALRLPAIDTCGTATIFATSTNLRGTIAISAGTPTACHMKFSHVLPDTPSGCFTEGPSSVLGAIGVTAASSSGILFNLPAAFSGAFSYFCPL